MGAVAWALAIVISIAKTVQHIGSAGWTAALVLYLFMFPTAVVLTVWDKLRRDLSRRRLDPGSVLFLVAISQSFGHVSATVLVQIAHFSRG